MSELTLTAKVQVLAESEDRKLLEDTLEAYRKACNTVSGYIFKTHDLRQFSVNEALYYELRSRFGLKAQMAQSVIKTVIARYKTILENQEKWIRPRFKKPQADLVWNRDYSLLEGCFSVNTLKGRLHLPYCKEGMEEYFDKEKYRFGTARLVGKHGKYFLHIPVTFEVKDVEFSEIANVVGIDRGINFIVATYDSRGKSGFVSGRQVKQKRAQYKRTRQSLQRRKTKSARRRLGKIGQRENRWMQDVNHQVSKALVENNPEKTLFVLEDLTGVRSATERVRTKDRYVSVSWAFYDLEEKLKYKAKRAGDMVINVDPSYTSQCCPVCGHTERANRRKKEHLFVCRNCGYSSNDDRIGAMNLHRMGINAIAEKAQVPGAVADGHILPAKGAINRPTMRRHPGH